MAAQYSNKQFFRKTPNQLLAQFFAAKSIPREVDLGDLDEATADVLQDVFNSLSDSQKAEIEAIFQDINALACEGGIAALIDEASFHNDETFVEAIAAIEGFHAKAMWAFLEKLSY